VTGLAESNPSKGLDDVRFRVRCESCGVERWNDDSPYECPQCGSSSLSYESDDARRWNEYQDESQ
jgi:Zn finger protein HypA/HybF involved in hydrogenase expression